MKQRILVIIPAFNEQECILDTVKNIQRSNFDYVVVNDGSQDCTLDICLSNGLNVLDLPQNLGIGGAVQAGHKFAYENDYDIDIQFDADGQHDATYLPALISAIEAGADLAIGSRFLEKTGGFQSTKLRKFGISWLSLWLKLFTGTRCADPTSGFRACSRRAIELFCNYYPVDYPEPESIAVAVKAGLNVKEIPVIMHDRQGGKSSIGGISSLYYMIKVSLAIAIDCVSGKTHRNQKRRCL